MCVCVLVQVLPVAWVPVSRAVAALGGTCTLRRAVAKAGPVVTDFGNFVLDADFGPIPDPAALNAALLPIVGLLETGLFIGMAERAYFGHEDGRVDVWSRPAK